MLNHTKQHVEKIHYIDAELAGHVHKLGMKLQSLCGNGFSLFAVRMLAKPYHCGVNWPTTLCEDKDITLPSVLNAITGITSYYRVILKIVILHDPIKTIQTKEQNFVSLKKKKKTF